MTESTPLDRVDAKDVPQHSQTRKSPPPGTKMATTPHSMAVMALGSVLSLSQLCIRIRGAGATACVYEGPVRWTADATGLFVKACKAEDATQRWSGDTLLTAKTPSTLTNAGAPAGMCLGTAAQDPVQMAAPATCSSTPPLFIYNHTNHTIALTVPGAGLGLCLDVNHGTGPDVDLYDCHASTNPDLPHQEFIYDNSTGQLRTALNASVCLALNRTKIMPYITPPCTWPSNAPAGVPFPSSDLLRGVTVLEDATPIAGYGADTW